VGEPFSRSKVINGVRKACQGRPVSEDDLAMLAQEVEENIRASGAAEIDAHEVGLIILGPLQKLDKVAYLRFASVYQAFESLEDFESAIALLRHESDAETKETPAADSKSPESQGAGGGDSGVKSQDAKNAPAKSAVKNAAAKNTAKSAL
jgi:transcriptional repressor NrdR